MLQQTRRLLWKVLVLATLHASSTLAWSTSRSGSTRYWPALPKAVGSRGFPRVIPRRQRCLKAETSSLDASDPPSVSLPSDAISSSSSRTIPRYNWTRQTTAIALPALVGMLADPMLSLMDTAYVGRVGTIELAALGACTSIFHLSFNAFRATTAATTSLVASRLAKDPDEARQVTLFSLQFGWWIGVGVTMVLLFGGRHALAGMGVNRTSPLYPAAADYLFTRCWAAPIVLLIGVSEGAFRGYGNTVVPLVASLTAALINLVLDPILMFPLKMGVKGAAAATALSQVGAAGVYGYMLYRTRMLPSWSLRKTQQQSVRRPTGVIRTIVGANLAMMTKQGSLLLGWAYATARATRMGAEHVAAHQVALSVWLVFALILDSTAVAAQVLMSRAYAQRDRSAIRNLTSYMLRFAFLQGLASMLIIDGLDSLVPQLFTPDPVIQRHLHKLMPYLAVQQILVSLTLVAESLAVGASQFKSLAVGTALSTVACVWQLSKQKSVEGIWGLGIVTLFAGRLLSACFATWKGHRELRQEEFNTVYRVE